MLDDIATRGRPTPSIAAPQIQLPHAFRAAVRRAFGCEKPATTLFWTLLLTATGQYYNKTPTGRLKVIENAPPHLYERLQAAYSRV